MTNARKGCGSGKQWDESPFWKNETNEYPHNCIVWGAVKKCKDCGEVL